MTTTTTLGFTEARNLLASIIRQPFTCPGGYERLIVTDDGGMLCSKCCRKEAKRIMSDIRDGYNTGWFPAGSTYEAVSAEHARECDPDLVSYCDHCNREFGEMGC